MADNILVTGGAGFIGSHLCEKLLEKGHKVVAVDNLFSGKIENLKSIINNRNFRFIKGDIRNTNAIAPLIKNSDTIYHLAAILGVSVIVNDPEETVSVNTNGTEIVAKLALKYGNKKVIFSSSSEVYGKNPKLPLNEDNSDIVFGSTKVSRWNYGMSKALAELILFDYAHKGLPITIVRYFNCYGPRCINDKYKHVIPKFIIQAINNEPITIYNRGTARRTFCYVADTVNCTIQAAEKTSNEIINIGSDEEIKIIDLAKNILKLTKSKSKIVFIPEDQIFDRKFEECARRIPDLSKTKNILHYRNKISIDEGIEKTYEWIIQNI